MPFYCILPCNIKQTVNSIALFIVHITMSSILHLYETIPLSNICSVEDNYIIFDDQVLNYEIALISNRIKEKKL